IGGEPPYHDALRLHDRSFHFQASNAYFMLSRCDGFSHAAHGNSQRAVFSSQIGKHMKNFHAISFPLWPHCDGVETDNYDSTSAVICAIGNASGMILQSAVSSRQ
ncbi:MAG: hypothetical protein ACYC4K_11115, partial [Thiobacillus sp.]